MGKRVKRLWKIKQFAFFSACEGWAEKDLLHFVLFAQTLHFRGEQNTNEAGGRLGWRVTDSKNKVRAKDREL